MRNEFTIIVNCSSKQSLRWTIVIIGNEDEHQLAISQPTHSEGFLLNQTVSFFSDPETGTVKTGRTTGIKTAVGDITRTNVASYYLNWCKRSEARQGIRPPPKLFCFIIAQIQGQHNS